MIIAALAAVAVIVLADSVSIVPIGGMIGIALTGRTMALLLALTVIIRGVVVIALAAVAVVVLADTVSVVTIGGMIGIALGGRPVAVLLAPNGRIAVVPVVAAGLISVAGIIILAGIISPVARVVGVGAIAGIRPVVVTVTGVPVISDVVVAALIAGIIAGIIASITGISVVARASAVAASVVTIWSVRLAAGRGRGRRIGAVVLGIGLDCRGRLRIGNGTIIHYRRHRLAVFDHDARIPGNLGRSLAKHQHHGLFRRHHQRPRRLNRDNVKGGHDCAGTADLGHTTRSCERHERG